MYFKNFQEDVSPLPNVVDESKLEPGAEPEPPRVAEEVHEVDELTLRLNQLAHEHQLGGEGSKYPRILPPMPMNLFTEQPLPPPEPSGVGVNSKVFYVTNDITGPWTQLPDLTPLHVRAARQIYKSFTGNLDQEIVTFPEFPSREKEYLRAQIARISAGTQISPLGYYTFGGGEGGEDEAPLEEEGSKTTYKINPKYDPVPIKDLTDGSMSFWVHHTQYILPQGRTSWWSPAPEGELGEAMGEGGDEEEGKPLGPEPETGPPLLTPLSEDASIESIPAWSVRCSSRSMEEYAIAIVRSHLWPGAYCFSTQGKTFQNIYLGTGLKYMVTNFSPIPLPPIEQDYPPGPEIMEIFDPTGAEEEAWRIAHLPVPKPLIPMGEEALPEEEEEEDEDD